MDLTQGLFDIIGIIIGFISIILLLSMVVTSLVQAFQAVVHLRARNLKRGIQSIIENIWNVNPQESNEFALKTLNAKNICILDRKNDPTTKINRLIGPKITYIDPKELPQALKEAGLDLNEESKKEVLDRFDKIWNQLESRFLFRIRLITIAFSLVVAAYFQISAPALLSKLSLDDVYRAKIVADAEGNKILGSIPVYENVTEKALAMLEAEFPEVEEKIEEASGVGEGKDSLIAELDYVLADLAENKEEILDRYNELLDSLYAEQKEAALKQAEAAISTLSKYDITGWPQGIVFYHKNGSIKWANIVGVLITAILLSFGAPFWFDRLQDVIKLKDALSKGIKPEKDKTKEKPDQQ